MIKITFLGTSGAIPTAERNHTSTLLTYENENILVDCGEGTQRQLRKAKINPCKITRLLITHWHGDHVLGIPGLIQTLAFSEYNKTLKIYGPKGTKKYMNELIRAFAFSGKLNMTIKEVGKGKIFEEKDFFVEAGNLYHGCPTLAYSFIKKGKLRIDKKKLNKTKLPEGIHLQKLKQGKDIIYQGKRYKSKDLTYETESAKVSFVLDTSFNKAIPFFVKNSDLLIIESTYSNELKERAKEHNHLTAIDAATIAKKGNVKKMILTHIGQRYEKNLDKILREAKTIFKNSYLAEDLKEIGVK